MYKPMQLEYVSPQQALRECAEELAKIRALYEHTEAVAAARQRQIDALKQAYEDAPWCAGLSMEEVHLKIQAGEAPGYREPGGWVQVPRGYLDWLVSVKR